MHRTDQKMPTGSANYPAGHTDAVTVPERGLLATVSAEVSAHIRDERGLPSRARVFVGTACYGLKKLLLPATADDDKAFTTLAARFALIGHSLVPGSDGSTSYYAMRWGQIKPLAPLDKAQRCLDQIGGAHHG